MKPLVVTVLWFALSCSVRGYSGEAHGSTQNSLQAIRAEDFPRFASHSRCDKEGCCELDVSSDRPTPLPENWEQLEGDSPSPTESSSDAERWVCLSDTTEIVSPITPPSVQPFHENHGMKKALDPSPDLLASPKVKEFIDGFSKLACTSQKLPLPEARKLSTRFFLSQIDGYDAVQRIENIEIASSDQASIPLRIYIPKESSALPVLVFFHRGGWVFGSIDEADSLCRKIANILGFVVISVEYRLAPEYPFPTPLEDCYAATQWVSENIDIFGGDHTRLIVGGESAGGNLAAAVALLARDKRGPHIAAQLLMYPAISALTEDEVYEACPDQYFMTKEGMRGFWKMYLRSPGDAGHAYACPDRADTCEGLPPCLLVTAEYDPLRREAERYGARLSQAKVLVVTKTIAGAIHGCIDLPVYEENQKRAWIQEIGQLLKKLEPMMGTQEYTGFNSNSR